MRVAGIGFRSTATLASLQDALARASTGGRVDLLATAEKKASAPVAQELAAMLGLELRALARQELARQDTLSHSERVAERFGTGSLCEAAALAAAGTGARLLGPRAVSGDGMATAAIAIGRER
ncbi:MAG: cobalamin biosynthesis protein [Rhodobacteraceae bacterium]|nr:cobalamin biosynthesis protein [Paracoccaceae bacterium]